VWRYHDYDTQRQLELWDRLGRQVLTAGTTADFEQFLRAYMQTPFGDAPERSGPVSWDLARDAMFLFYADHRAGALSRMVNMVNFWRANDQQVGGWPVAQQIDRMLGLLNVRPLGKAARKSRRTTYVADALSPPVSRAADGILSELQSALDAKQYTDAARILAGSNPPRECGLVPAPDDDQLFVSFHVALRMLMRGHDGFREAMNRQVGPADELKIDQCLGRGDPAAVQVLPLQYYGTPAAAPPCQWLGDRALSAADPAEAIHWYDEALRVAAPLQQAELGARKRLASAMLGKLQGQPPSQAVSLGGEKVPPERFEGWVKEQLARARSGLLASLPAEAAKALTVAQPATIEAVSRGQWNENAGRGFRREEMPWEFYDVDWTWRHLSLRAEEDGLFVFHRSRIAAFEPGGEKPRWNCNLGNAWSPAPLCPVFTASRIYLCAALAPECCGVACLDRKTGRRLWLCECDGMPVSDPLWRPGNTGYPGRLFVLAVGRGQRQPSAPLTLVELDPENGDVVARQPIIEMTEHANLPGQCQAVAAGHRLVVLVAGNVLCADFQGRLLWLRQRVTLPCQVDAAVPLQAMQPAIARGERLFVQQPGSCVVDCLDAETGERHWRRGIVGLRSISELQGERLLARTDWGLVAVSQETGEVVWQRAVPGLFAIDARTTSGLVLAARQVVNGDKPQVAFLWIDGATGRSRGESSIPLTDNRPARFGPIAVRGDHAWTAYGYGPKDDSPTAENNKRIVELRFGKPIAE